MLTLVRIPRSDRSAAALATLVEDYLAFDRRRLWRRQYIKAFGSLAIVVAFGAVFRFVPRREALVAGGLLTVPPGALALLEGLHWRRLVRRLDALRASIQQVET
jgi:hypothetical protein